MEKELERQCYRSTKGEETDDTTKRNASERAANHHESRSPGAPGGARTLDRPHANPGLGWGYTWRGRNWEGPYPTPGHAVQAAFEDAVKALQFRSAAPFTQLASELWRLDGDEAGWFHIGGPGTEDDEEAGMIDIPGPAQRWQQALRVGYRACADATVWLNSWSDELDIHHERDRGAFDRLAEDEPKEE
jgi:hypothetical protein